MSVQEKIEEFGWAFVAVPDGAPAPFGYTVGLTESFGHAEFIVIGFSPNVAHRIIAEAVDALKESPAAFGQQAVPGVIKVKVDEVYQDGYLGCRDVVQKYKAFFLGAAAARYGKDGVRAKQLVLPDKSGKLPWEEGFDKEWGGRQPALY